MKKVFSILIVISSIFVLSCSNQIVQIEENANLRFQILWPASQNTKSISSQTDCIIVTISSNDMANYQKSYFVKKNNNLTVNEKIYPGNYKLIVFSCIINEDNSYKILDYYNHNIICKENKTTNIEAELFPFIIDFNYDIPANYNYNKEIDFTFSMPDNFPYLYINYLNIQYDFNNNDLENDDFINSVRITSSKINYIKNKIKFTIKNKRDFYINNHFKLKVGKIRIYIDKDLFIQNFYKENNIKKIYYQIENIYLDEVLLKETSSINIIIK